MAADRTVSVQVTGAKELRRQLRAAGVDSKDALKRGHSAVSDIGTEGAKARAPVLGGGLRSDIRSAPTTTKAQVRAGNRGRPRLYAGVQNYGGYQGIAGTHYMEESVSGEWPRIARTYEEFVEDLVVDVINRKR